MATELFDFDVAVIGGGVIGLAVAGCVAQAGPSVVVIEQASAPGEGISSRNSGVIHSGIYYKTGSLKHRLCVQGRDLLVDFARDRNIGFAVPGKLVVACSSKEIADLEALLARAIENDVAGLQLIDGNEATQLEPNLKVEAAILSPNTGIIDQHGFIAALVTELEAAGGIISLRSQAMAASVSGGRHEVLVKSDGGEIWRVGCKYLINSAGLSAWDVARAHEAFEDRFLPRRALAKGSYFRLRGASPFKRMIYPLPAKDVSGLGIHSTLELDGTTKFGPDVEWIDEPDYRVDETRMPQFATSIRRYFPGLGVGRLAPGYVGIRPKLGGPGEAAADFLFQDKATHGVPGLINLFGIESPGLTAALATGKYVLKLMGYSPGNSGIP